MSTEHEYAEKADHLRVFDEGDGWGLDGFDKDTEKYTQSVWKFDTPDEALAQVGEFARNLENGGIQVSVKDEKFQVHVDGRGVVEVEV